ncbi:hypothetical protein [Spirosoma spitsbergense]|jgi:hypothetical protein|uniref:hypothetical protein n=1 Tax=Spirosoma spitsbergense TaxID=431554 RepID=UPI00035F1C96|nr:hypothetical protein [Spirosoma spitsbergense]
MKKTGMLLFVLFLGLVVNGFAQTAAPTDFYAGKWEISIAGTPSGDVKLLTDLVRKDGKLTGELTDAVDATKPKMAIDKIDEDGDKLVIHFDSPQAAGLALNLAKVDADTLKGEVYNFDAVAKRVK